MAGKDKPQQERPSQRTPKGHEIPVPKRGDFMRDLRKAAKTKGESDSDDPGGAEQQ
ncbi:hypothetical protein BH24ACT15_BH24ACT15_05530 [soil metagenome]